MNQPIRNPSGAPMNRRHFLKTSSTAVVGGSLLGSLALERGVFAAGDDTLKIALIGCGGRGTGAASQALSTKGSVQLVAMADAFRDRLDSSYRNLKKQHPDRVSVDEDHKFIGFDAYKHAIAAADVVLLTTPPGFRPIQFEEAVRQGKHIFMEKPVAVDGPGIRQVLAAAQVAKQKNLKVSVGLQRHHQIGYIETIKRLQDGAIGDITSMRAYWDGNGVWTRARKPGQTEMQYQMRNWYYFVWLCGDHIVEQHIHNLDVINWVKNSYPVRGQGMGGRLRRKGPNHGEIFDHHFVEFEYADGSHLSSQCRHMIGCWSQVSEHVTGTKGLCDVSGYHIQSYDGGNDWRHNRRGDPNPYQVEHNDLFDAIRHNKPHNEAEYGAKSTMTAIFGRMCTYSGRVITWEEALNSKVAHRPEAYAWDANPPTLPGPDGLYPIPEPGVPDWIRKVV